MSDKPKAADLLAASPLAFELPAEPHRWCRADVWDGMARYQCTRKAHWGLKGMGQDGKARAFCTVHAAKRLPRAEACATAKAEPEQ